jgi:ABC-2 type transport system permease protein
VSRVLRILVREYLENVRTKAFLIGVFLTPLLMGLTFLIPMLAPKPQSRALALVDLTGDLGDDVATGIGTARLDPADPRSEPVYRVERVDLGAGDAAARAAAFGAARSALDRRVLDGDLYAYVVLKPGVLEKARGAVELRTGNVMDAGSASASVRATLEGVLNRRAVQTYGVPKEAEAVLSKRVDVEVTTPAAEGAGGTVAAAVTPLVFTFLLFFGIVGISQALITSTLEEKGNRVVEVLLSSVSPFQLMAGKVLGICLVGLTLMGIWAVGGGTALAAQGFGGLVAPGQVGLFLVYYLLGFLLIASLMVAVGSACNTLKEAQNLLSPVMVVLILPIMLVMMVARDPNGSLATTLSFVPPFTPFFMMMRVSSVPPPPAWQVAVSVLILAVATYLAVRLAARVFRVGILLYGKPPSLRELFRWMRAGA